MTLRPLAISLLLASPAGAATVPAFVIEAHPCGTVHTLHEAMDGVVVANERGSRRYVCGYGENPLPWPDDMLSLKTYPETPALPATPGTFWPVASTPRAVAGARAGGASASAAASSWSLSGAGASSFSHVHTAGCPCGRCEAPWKPKPPVPAVPLPGSGLALLTAIMAAVGLLWRRRHS